MQLFERDAIPWGIIRDVFGLDQKVIDYYRKEDQGTMSNELTREIVDQTVKDDPSLSLQYAIGKDPIELLKEKLQHDTVAQKAEETLHSVCKTLFYIRINNSYGTCMESRHRCGSYL